MAIHAKTQKIIDVALEVLRLERPMTVRQVYYALVSRQVIKNNRSQYQAVSKALVRARKEGEIPWDWIEDRLRRPRQVQMYDGLKDFAGGWVWQYKRNVWEDQPGYVECWLEKDALSGVFEEILWRYGVTLNVGRGYDGWDSLYRAAERFRDAKWANGPPPGAPGAPEAEWMKDVTILYFGDFDPSGEDMVRSLRERLGFFGCHPRIVKCALTLEDIEHYGLPPNFTKQTDTRTAGFVEKYGDISVELDALPVDVLRERIRTEVESYVDMDALTETKDVETRERERLEVAVASVEG